jgi:hypothetical protein
MIPAVLSAFRRYFGVFTDTIPAQRAFVLRAGDAAQIVEFAPVVWM